MPILFKDALEQAIDNYQLVVTNKKKTLSNHRARSIIDLRGIIREETDLHQLQSKVVNYVQNLRTGFWLFGLPIYQTGNSLLKDNIMKVVDDPNYLLINMNVQDDIDLRTVTYGDPIEQDDDFLDDKPLDSNPVSQPLVIPSVSINYDPPEDESPEKKVSLLTLELKKSHQLKCTMEREKDGIIEKKDGEIGTLRNS